MTSVSDLYPHLIRRGHRRELLLLFVCVVCFLIGLVMVTPVSPIHRVWRVILSTWPCFCFALTELVLLCVHVCLHHIAGWSVCVPDLWPFFLQRSQPAAPLYLPVSGHRLGIWYESEFLSLHFFFSSFILPLFYFLPWLDFHSLFIP